MTRPRPMNGLVIALAALALPMISCAPGPADDPEAASEDLVTTDGSSCSDGTINITYTLPQDIPRDSSMQDLAQFAWEEFLALNWQAGYPSGTSRGEADTQWKYSTVTDDSYLPTWLTYAQTTELRPNGPLTTAWDDLGTPVYSYQAAIAQGTVMPPAGSTDPPPATAASFTLWSNLDEDNEIGSANIYPDYSNQTDPKNLVLYQVKVNKDEYEYVRQNFGPDQDKCATNDPNCPPANQTLNGGALYNAQASQAGHIQKPPYDYYSGADGDTCNCGPVTGTDSGKTSAICLPCGGATDPVTNEIIDGAVEIKSAWKLLSQQEIDSESFYARPSIYYYEDSTNNNQLTYGNAVFGLIGIHIIRKTQHFPDFIFATFEHESVETGGYVYVELNSGAQTGDAVPIVRQAATPNTNTQQNHAVPSCIEDVNTAVHNQLNGILPAQGSVQNVWVNYRLTGVQGQSIKCETPPPLPGPGQKKGNTQTQACINQQNTIQAECQAPSTTSPPTGDPNYFQANFVIESDPFLNNFSGPGFGSNPYSACQNTVYDGELYNNGGCKGCHGVAQTSFGTDFSFLLDFGNNKPSIAPATLHYSGSDEDPPESGVADVKTLKNYMKGAASSSK